MSLDTTTPKNHTSTTSLTPLSADEEKRLDAMANIPYPRVEVGLHVAKKAVQAGSVVGCVLGVPLALWKHRTTTRGILSTIGRAGVFGVMTMSVLSGGLLTYKYMGMDDDGAYDRAFRLRHNEGQVRVDRLSSIGLAAGAAVGAIAALITRVPPLTFAIATGAVMGTALGVAAHVATFKKKS